MTATGYFDQNYTGANQSVNTDTIDIPSLNVYNFKKIYKKRSGR